MIEKGNPDNIKVHYCGKRNWIIKFHIRDNTKIPLVQCDIQREILLTKKIFKCSNKVL